MIKVRVKKYDVNVTEPPYQFITVDEFEIEQEPTDDMLFSVLSRECAKLGHSLQCYSLGSDDYDYDIVAHLGRQEYPDCYDGKFGCTCAKDYEENISFYYEDLTEDEEVEQ